METKLKSLNLQMEEFKRIEDVKIEVIKYQRNAAVQFSYMVPERKLYVSFTINETSKHFYHFRRVVNTNNR